MVTKKKPKLLIVDDETDLLELYAKRLHRAGFEVVTAKDGIEAIEHIKNDLFDAIICDINMPGGVNGFDVFDFTRTTVPRKQPFIFVTGHGEGTPEMKYALSLGADAVYAKPVSSRVLIQHLYDLCGCAD